MGNALWLLLVRIKYKSKFANQQMKHESSALKRQQPSVEPANLDGHAELSEAELSGVSAGLQAKLQTLISTSLATGSLATPPRLVRANSAFELS